jgi:hypothetical protein
VCGRAADGGAERRCNEHELIVEVRNRAPVSASAVRAFCMHRLNRSFELEPAEPWIACCGDELASPELHAHLKDLLTRYNVNDYAASVKVFAVKP